MNVYENLIQTLFRQESMLRFPRFSNQDALDIGNFLVNRAREHGLAMSVSVRKANGAILFHHLMEGTCTNNQNWMMRKFNTVMLFEHCSLYGWAHQQMTGETIKVHGLSDTEYVSCGGGFPVLTQSGELVGAIIVSNLPHFQDHAFIVEALSEWLHVDGVPTAIEPAD